MKNRLTALFITLIMLLSALPAAAFANTTVEPTSAVQIGSYFEVDDANGTISGSEAPQLAAGSTQQSYADGHVKVNKIIAGTNTENVFKITLEVAIDESVIFDVQERSGDAAVVLVVDMSASMLNNYKNNDRRIDAANKAIAAFVEKYKADMGSSTRKIAVVGFGGYKASGNSSNGKDGAWTHLGWTDVTANTSVNTLSATTNTGTNLEAGIILAKNLLSDKLYNGAGEEITNKSIILLSDGQPTYHVNDTWEKQSTSTTVICEDGEHIGGSGSSTTCNEHKPVETLMQDAFFTNINKYAVYIAGNNDKLNCQSDNCALNSNIGIQSWLGNVCDFNTILADGAGNLDLSTVFEDIATHITLEGTPGLVTDPMGQNVDLHAVGSTKVEDFVLNTNNPVNVEDNILGWNLKVAEPAVNGDIKTYTLTYDATLDTLDPNFETGIFFPTNGVTDLPYGIKNANTGKLESVGVAFFNLPSVQGYTGSFSFNKVDESEAPLAGAVFKLEHAEVTDPGDPHYHYHHTHDWATTATSDSNGVVTFANIPSGHHYTLTEITAPNGYTKSGDTYEVVVDYGAVTVKKDGVQVYPAAEGSTSDTFSVANTKDVTGITVKKVWEGKNDGIYPDSVQVQLYADGVASGSPVTLSANNVAAEGNWTYTWSDLRRTNASGEAILYKVEEVSAHNDYTVTYSSLTDGVITITNKYDPAHGKLKLTKIFAGEVTSAPAGFDAEFTVTGDGYAKTVKWSEFEGGHYVLEGLNPGTYTVTETIKGTSPAYTVSTAYAVNGIAINQVTVAAGHTAQLDITNTYSDSTETIYLTVNKVWAGEDTTNRRPGEVQVQLTASENISYSGTVSLTADNGWSHTFTGLPKYANGSEVVYGVREISIVSRYTPSYGSITAVEGVDNAYAITVTNTYQGVEFSVPVYKVVEGDNAPAETFEFDVKINKLQVDPTPAQYVSYGGAVVTAQGANGTVASYADGKLTVQTNGKGEYLAWLYFVVPKDEAGKFAVSISEEDGGAAGWTYDESEWLVTVDCSGSTPTYASQKDPAVINEAEVQPPTFTNSYAKPTNPTPTPRPHRPSADPTPYPIDFIPKSGDVSIIGYTALAVIAAAGAMGYKRKK